MSNKPYKTRLKLARKNAEREIDQSRRAGLEGRILDVVSEYEICFRHAYPLGLWLESLSEFDYFIKRIPYGRGFGRVAKNLMRKGFIIKYSNWQNFERSGEKDLRKLCGSTYNLTKKLKMFETHKLRCQNLYTERIERLNLHPIARINKCTL